MSTVGEQIITNAAKLARVGMSVRRPWAFQITGLALGLVVGALGMVIAWAYAGGGHGTYLPATILFPYTMFLAKTIVGTISGPLMVLTAVEFPAYGFIIGTAASRSRAWLALLTVLVLHAGALVLGLYNANPIFSHIPNPDQYQHALALPNEPASGLTANEFAKTLD